MFFDLFVSLSFLLSRRRGYWLLFPLSGAAGIGTQNLLSIPNFCSKIARNGYQMPFPPSNTQYLRILWVSDGKIKRQYPPEQI
ncbi:MAG: hypothetical protein J6B19_03010 [Lachnospiraceae bacterium]|nr:hypothetical protein [Lachnospiraceae bacterium]